MSQETKKFRVNISLDKDTHNLLVQLSTDGGYETVSRAVRSLVKKYGKREIDFIKSQEYDISKGNHTK